METVCTDDEDSDDDGDEVEYDDSNSDYSDLDEEEILLQRAILKNFMGRA